MHRTALIRVILLLLPMAGGQASAHSSLDHGDPRVGNTVTTAPHEVTLWFTQKLEPAFSSLSVTNATGARVDTGKARVSGDSMSISLRQIGAGTYRVNGRVLSMGTHATDGNYIFQVGL